MAKHRPPLHPDAPLYLNSHRRPITRRELIAQGFKAGVGTVVGSSLLSLFANPQPHAALPSDIAALRYSCGISSQGAGKIPFIRFHLAGGANITGYNVLIGKQCGQLDFISTSCYSNEG